MIKLPMSNFKCPPPPLNFYYHNTTDHKCLASMITSLDDNNELLINFISDGHAGHLYHIIAGSVITLLPEV